RRDHRHLTMNQVGRKCWQAIVMILRPAVLDRHIPPLHIAGLRKTLEKWRGKRRICVGRRAGEKSNHWHRRLLCSCGERPRGCRAAEQRDELAAAVHSITSSARASTLVGISSPSALAVLRLITSLYLVAAWTGSSAGFSPLRMRST